MWVPASADDIERVVQAGSLNENAHFDAKREVGTKNKEVAKDIAAMANNGGVVLYGVDEDDQKRPTVLHPIPLAGIRERIDAIVHTSIAPPPTIRLDAHPLASAPECGYVVVVVPPSAMAPHLVTADKDNRYYQRLETQNVSMSEADIARLYARRQSWERDRATLLRETIARNHAIWPVDADYADLHLMIRPVAMLDASLLDTALGTQDPTNFFGHLLAKARTIRGSLSYQPDLQPNWILPRDEGWRLGSGPEETAHDHLVDLTVTQDGKGYLYCGRAGGYIGSQSRSFVLIEDLVAGLTAQALALLGDVYAAARYYGPVDIGIAITGLIGKTIYSAKMITNGSYMLTLGNIYRLPRTEEYQRSERVALAAELVTRPCELARTLTGRLVSQVTNGSYDPLTL